MGDNINGPSLIRVPDWIENPLGRYYLYFGHHKGRYIRLAYADDISGPWRIHSPGVLSLEDSYFAGHIASPDVHVDAENGRIRMYFHGVDLTAGPLDCCITIRTIAMKDGKASVQAGAGIVADSDPAAEYQETRDKASALIRALEMAQAGQGPRGVG